MNSCINTHVRNFPNTISLSHGNVYPNLAVFYYFISQLLEKNVVVIGYHPNILHYQH